MKNAAMLPVLWGAFEKNSRYGIQVCSLKQRVTLHLGPKTIRLPTGLVAP